MAIIWMLFLLVALIEQNIYFLSAHVVLTQQKQNRVKICEVILGLLDMYHF